MKLFIKEDSRGNIIAVSHEAQSKEWKPVDDSDVRVQTFITQLKSDSLQQLAETDQAMSRVIEDLVGLLVDQGTIRFTDLPLAAQQKLLSRREMRGQARGMDLLDDGDDLNI